MHALSKILILIFRLIKLLCNFYVYVYAKAVLGKLVKPTFSISL